MFPCPVPTCAGCTAAIMPSIRGIRRITVNFDPTEEQRQWRDLARDFAQGEIRPRAADLDREQKFPYDIVADMARLGLMGLTLPEEYGGSGGDFVAYNLALEEISRADTSVGITMEAHISLGCAPIAAYGTQEQKETFLSRCATGENLWAFGLTQEGRARRRSSIAASGSSTGRRNGSPTPEPKSPTASRSSPEPALARTEDPS